MDEDQALEAGTTARDAAGQLAAVRDQLAADLPRSRELSTALTKLDEAGMWLERVR